MAQRIPLRKKNAKNVMPLLPPELTQEGTSYAFLGPKIRKSPRAIATRRFYSLERRFERDPALKQTYHAYIEEYLRLGHMQKLDVVDDEIPHCYLPHHPVFKESSTTTKVRVVFDASCKTSSGISLNDTLLVGPVMQQDLVTITIRFRFHVIAFVADVEKMYRQVFHFPIDQHFLRIVFRRNPTDPLDTYELLTITYGTASAPFLATRTLQQLAKDEGDKYPEAVEAVVEDFYVDDLLSGADNLESTIEIIVAKLLLCSRQPVFR
ncbi:uncharacterized protein LOC135703482 [Ochlerotatus camptorhynchus]|uniref:uncharacterized protein LOC135703482 n=1 Tax=Ochlerotatus camptorhynchus TaxID=644619 RepID=UPI0031DEE520